MFLPLIRGFSGWGPGLAELLSPPTPEAGESRGRLPLQFRRGGTPAFHLGQSLPFRARVSPNTTQNRSLKSCQRPWALEFSLFTSVNFGPAFFPDDRELLGRVCNSFD